MTSTPASVSSAAIEDPANAANSSTFSKRDSAAVKDAPFFEEKTSAENTPGTGTKGRPKAASAITVMAKQSAAAGGGKGKGKKTTRTKEKPELVTPAEFARRLRLRGQTPVAGPSEIETARQQASIIIPAVKEAPSQYLKDYVIFYAGGDLTYASARTRGCMSYVRGFLFFFSRKIKLISNSPGRSTSMVGTCSQFLTLRR